MSPSSRPGLDAGTPVTSLEAAVVYATAGPGQMDERIRSLVDDQFDWSRFLWLAIRERAVPIAWRRFQRMGLPVPAAVAAELQRHTMVADFTASRLSDRLAETLAAFRQAEVEPVLLKGAALGQSLYPDFRDRPMGDIDLLVLPDEATASLDAARASGWVVVPSYVGVDYSHHHHLLPMEDPTGAGRLEIHTGLFVTGHPFGSLEAAVRESSLPVPGGWGRIPTDAHLALHICLHLAWSHVMGLGAWRAFLDLTTLTEAGRLDWDQLLAEARTYRATTCCYWTLRLAQQLAGVAVPEEVLAEAAPPGTWMHRALDRHFHWQVDGPDRECPSVALWHLLWRAAIRPRWSGHGGSYPWAASEPFLEAAGDGPVHVGVESPARAARIGPTLRYVRDLLRRDGLG